MARMTVSKTVDLSSTLSSSVYTTGLLKSVLSNNRLIWRMRLFKSKNESDEFLDSVR